MKFISLNSKLVNSLSLATIEPQSDELVIKYTFFGGRVEYEHFSSQEAYDEKLSQLRSL